MQRLGKGKHPSNNSSHFLSLGGRTKVPAQAPFELEENSIIYQSQTGSSSPLLQSQAVPLPCWGRFPSAKAGLPPARGLWPLPRPLLAVSATVTSSQHEAECPSLIWHSSLQSGSDRAPGTGMSWRFLSVCLCARRVQTHPSPPSNCSPLLPAQTCKPTWAASHIWFYT